METDALRRLRLRRLQMTGGFDMRRTSLSNLGCKNQQQKSAEQS